MGLSGYYRRFVLKFFSVASPLSDLTKKGKLDRVQWTEEAEWAFQAFKQALTSSPVIQNPDYCLPFTVHRCFGVSRKLTPGERKYATVEQEALIIK